MTFASKARRLAAGIALVGSVLVPLATTTAHSPASGAHAAVKRIFVIMLENHSQSTVIGDPNAPYITGLASRYGEATNYYGVTLVYSDDAWSNVLGPGFEGA